MSLSEDWLSHSQIEVSFDLAKLRASLQALNDSRIDGLVKGFPARAPAMPLGDVGKQNWNLLAEELPFPVAVLRRSALEHNAGWMQGYQERHGLSLAPHAKTTMAPLLWALQAKAGCWGLTVATLQQAKVAERFGCRNIILANEVLGHADLMGLVSLHNDSPSMRLFIFVESEAGIKTLLQALRGCGCERPLDVLLEIGMEEGRAGCRNLKTVDRMLDLLAGERERLHLSGISAFEGNVRGPSDPRLKALLDLVHESAKLADERNVFCDGEAILSAGGSAYFDIVTERLKEIQLSRPTRILLRSGCYLTHDSKHYEMHQQERHRRNPEQFQGMDSLLPSLFVWAIVQAMPEPGLAILSAGKRDLGHDLDMPEPVFWFRRHKTTEPAMIQGLKIFRLDDQHAYMRVEPATDIAIGDMIGLGISHPCTTFDRWRLIHVVDDHWISKGALLTFF